MTRPTDETLMAYADGQLDDLSRATVERYLLRDAETQRFVNKLTLVAAMARQAFADQDFTRGMDRLVNRINRAAPSRFGVRKPGKSNSAWWMTGYGSIEPLAQMQWFGGTGFAGAAWVAGTATAAIAVAWLALTVLPQQREADPTMPWELSLGEVRNGSTLRAALDDGPAPRRPLLGQGFGRYTVIAEFKDKFGNPCRELDAFDEREDRLPAAIVVACRGSNLTWSVLGVVATRSTQTGAYVADAVQAHDAMSGVLQMLGANRRTSGIKSESEMR